MTRAGVIRLVVLATGVGLLEFACRFGLIDRFSLIPPSTMVASAVDILISGKWTSDILITLGTVAVAAALSILGGFFYGLILFAFPRFKRAADPFLASYYAVPTFVFYPLF